MPVQLRLLIAARLGRHQRPHGDLGFSVPIRHYFADVDPHYFAAVGGTR